jgi:hypothetical protein
VTTLATPDAVAAQPGARIARSGKRVLVWIRGVGHRRPERWHLRRDIPAYAHQLTQVVAACGAWFSLADVTDLAYSGWMPSERNRCPGCDLARRAE